MGAPHAVRTAMLAKLRSSLPQSVGVYADPPADMKLPAITIDRIFDQPDDPLDEWITEITVTFTIWSRVRGPREAEQLRDDLRLALHDADLVLTEGRAVKCRYVRGDVTRDQDGETYMGSVLVAVTVEH